MLAKKIDQNSKNSSIYQSVESKDSKSRLFMPNNDQMKSSKNHGLRYVDVNSVQKTL